MFWETRHSSHESDHFSSFCGKSQRATQNLSQVPSNTPAAPAPYDLCTLEVSVGRQPLDSTETEGPVCAERLVMIRRHYGDALVLMASFTGGSILMFGP